MFFELLRAFIKNNADLKNLIGNNEIIIQMNIHGVKPYHLIITRDTCKYDIGTFNNPSFTFNSNLVNLGKLILGELDPSIGLFSGIFQVQGDFNAIINFLELLDFIGEKLGILKRGERRTFIQLEDMKKLLDIYLNGSEYADPSILPLFLEILTAFTNLNPKAQNFIRDENQIFLIELKDDSSYVIQLKNGKMRWYEGTSEFFTFKAITTLKDSIDIVITGNPISPYLKGNLIIEGDISYALFYQELIHLFLDHLGLIEKI